MKGQRAPAAVAVALGPTRILVELRLGNLVSATVSGYRAGDEALVPLSALLQLAEIRHEIRADGTLDATVEPGSVRLGMTAAHDTMSYGSRRAVVPRELKLFEDGELFVGVHALAPLLGLDVVVDWSELAVTITNPGSLPIAQRIAREAARQAFLRRGETAAGPAVRYPLERPRWDGLVLDYAFSAPGADPLRAGSYSLATGMNAFGGSLEATFASSGVAPARAVRSTASWTGVWADNTWVKQLRLGDGISTGPSPRLHRGVTVTNSPFLRPTYFGTNTFSGMLAPGWEVEAYRGGQLIAFDSTDALGLYGIPIPAHYGENPVYFVAYGPFGEVRRFDRMYRVGDEQLPARRFEYGASVGACAAGGGCAAAANVDLRYGVSARWHVRAGYDGFRRDTLATLSHPYVSVSGSPTDAIGVQLQGVSRASARGLLRYEPSTSLRLAGEYTRFAESGSVPALTPAGWRERWLVSGLLRPRGHMGSAYVEGEAAQIETNIGTILRSRLLASVESQGVRVSPYVRLERDDAGSIGGGESRWFAGVSASILPRTYGGSLLRGAWIRATLEGERSVGLWEASATVARQFARGVRVEAGGRWTRASAAATLLTAVDLAAVRSYTTVLVPRTGTPTVGEYVQGSVVLNTATREVALTAGPSVQRSGVAGRVFLDANMNGLFDRGEALLPKVTLRLGATAATSDSAGWFEVRNLAPFEPTPVVVDSLTLPSPLWIPGFETMSIVPGPNRFVVVDVPIVPGGVVEGRVVLEAPGGRQGVASAGLALVDRRTGARRPVTTFVDGEFTAIAVRPASYDITVDERLLARLGASAEPARFVLAADPDGALIRGIEVILRRTATSHVATDARASVAPAEGPTVTRATTVPVAPSSDSLSLAQSGSPAPARRQAVAAALPAVAQSPLPTVQYTVYTVRRHDTLRRIAQRLLGNETRWVEIYRDNRSQVKQPDLIHPGTRLRINFAPRGGTAR